MTVYLLFRKSAVETGLVGVYFDKAQAMLDAVAEAPAHGDLTGGLVRWTLGDELVHHPTPDHYGTVLFYILERRVLGTPPPVWAVECQDHYGVGPPESAWTDGLYATKAAADTRAERLRAERGDAPPFILAKVKEYEIRGLR